MISSISLNKLYIHGNILVGNDRLVYVFWGSILLLVQILFSFFMSIVMYENECEAKENEMKTRDKIELQHINSVGKAISWSISSTFCVHYTVCAVQVRNVIVPVILFFGVL